MKHDRIKKSKKLEEPFGTARSRLHKRILFELVQQSGRDNCFHCGEKIENFLQLSVEHKIPWFNSEEPKKNFHSLSNISFSHWLCNASRGSKVNDQNVVECERCCGFRILGKRALYDIRRGVRANICRPCSNEKRRTGLEVSI